MEIELTFENRTEINDYDEEFFENIALTVFNHLHLDDYFILEVNLVDLETIHQINRDYRKIDRPTDVISFAFEDEFQGETKILRQKGMPRDLGEIFICMDIMKKQAEEYAHSELREISFLFTHGLLHLLGYDHMKEEDEKIMFSIQDEIMELLHL